MIDLTTYALLRKQITSAASGVSDVRAEGDELVFVLEDGREVRIAIPVTEIRDAVVRDDVLVLTLADGKDAVIDATLTQSGQAADAKAAGDAVRKLKNDIANVNARLPEVNEDGETHRLLEDSDIDETLSVPGKVADASAAGNAIHAVAGEYELIESVTLSEDTAFSREAEPDGTPYAFDAVMVRLTTSGDQAGTNAMIMFDDKSSSLNGVAWVASLANNTKKKRAFVWCEKCRGMWHMNLRPFASIQTIAKLESDILYHTAKKIVGVVFTGTLSAGVTVDIYGVRSRGVSV